ncbi:hypothetical protein A8O14_00495 [Polynucleobacter wuianus]|uniref:Uncharacterized protein n=2 Tax=Burkholderiaceae TaxID=119060 RepID=A0A191UCL8_9BURK|nr:hypothetical protein A8O14_00495 [Polynucleobacter wuianus]
MGMPSRHISPQSFDEILSELGDDPAIPDPHGIRKSSSPKAPPKSEPPSQTLPLADLKKIGLFIALGIGLIGLGLALFTAYDSMNSHQDLPLESNQKEIIELRKELASLHEQVLEIEDDLYESIDLLEVSIHSLRKNTPSIVSKPKPIAIPFEAELRSWRYLGLSQINSSQRAFFHNGKGTVMLEKGSSALGDWRLHNIEKELATFSHSQGKSLTLKPSKTE